MVKAFTPRKKKPVKVLDKRTKTVRIDANTLIEVSVSISDVEARRRYFVRHNITPEPKNAYPLTEDEVFKEPKLIPIEDIEEIANEEGE